MKKLFFGLIILLMSTSISAQNVSFGPSHGFGHSWITGSDNVKFKPGFNVGGTLVYSFHPQWGVGADIKASFLEGNKTGSSTNQTSTLNANYLRIPLKAFHFFGSYGDKVRPKLYGGPSFGFLLGGKNRPSQGQEGNVRDVLEPFDFGFIAGAGLNYRLCPATWLNLDLVYTNGLIDVSKSTAFNSSRNISVNLGVAFPLGTIRQ